MLPKLQKKLNKLKTVNARKFPNYDINYAYDRKSLKLYTLVQNQQTGVVVSIKNLKPLPKKVMVNLLDENDEPFEFKPRIVGLEVIDANGTTVVLAYDHDTQQFINPETGEPVDSNNYRQIDGSVLEPLPPRFSQKNTGGVNQTQSISDEANNQDTEVLETASNLQEQLEQELENNEFALQNNPQNIAVELDQENGNYDQFQNEGNHDETNAYQHNKDQQIIQPNYYPDQGQDYSSLGSEPQSYNQQNYPYQNEYATNEDYNTGQVDQNQNQQTSQNYYNNISQRYPAENQQIVQDYFANNAQNYQNLGSNSAQQKDISQSIANSHGNSSENYPNSIQQMQPVDSQSDVNSNQETDQNYYTYTNQVYAGENQEIAQNYYTSNQQNYQNLISEANQQNISQNPDSHLDASKNYPDNYYQTQPVDSQSDTNLNQETNQNYYDNLNPVHPDENQQIEQNYYNNSTQNSTPETVQQEVNQVIPDLYAGSENYPENFHETQSADPQFNTDLNQNLNNSFSDTNQGYTGDNEQVTQNYQNVAPVATQQEIPDTNGNVSNNYPDNLYQTQSTEGQFNTDSNQQSTNPYGDLNQGYAEENQQVVQNYYADYSTNHQSITPDETQQETSQAISSTYANNSENYSDNLAQTQFDDPQLHADASQEYTEENQQVTQNYYDNYTQDYYQNLSTGAGQTNNYLNATQQIEQPTSSNNQNLTSEQVEQIPEEANTDLTQYYYSPNSPQAEQDANGNNLYEIKTNDEVISAKENNISNQPNKISEQIHTYDHLETKNTSYAPDSINSINISEPNPKTVFNNTYTSVSEPSQLNQTQHQKTSNHEPIFKTELEPSAPFASLASGINNGFSMKSQSTYENSFTNEKKSAQINVDNSSLTTTEPMAEQEIIIAEPIQISPNFEYKPESIANKTKHQSVITQKSIFSEIENTTVPTVKFVNAPKKEPTSNTFNPLNDKQKRQEELLVQTKDHELYTLVEEKTNNVEFIIKPNDQRKEKQNVPDDQLFRLEKLEKEIRKCQDQLNENVQTKEPLANNNIQLEEQMNKLVDQNKQENESIMQLVEEREPIFDRKNNVLTKNILTQPSFKTQRSLQETTSRVMDTNVNLNQNDQIKHNELKTTDIFTKKSGVKQYSKTLKADDIFTHKQPILQAKTGTNQSEHQLDASRIFTNKKQVDPQINITKPKILVKPEIAVYPQAAYASPQTPTYDEKTANIIKVPFANPIYANEPQLPRLTMNRLNSYERAWLQEQKMRDRYQRQQLINERKNYNESYRPKFNKPQDEPKVYEQWPSRHHTLKTFNDEITNKRYTTTYRYPHKAQEISRSYRHLEETKYQPSVQDVITKRPSYNYTLSSFLSTVRYPYSRRLPSSKMTPIGFGLYRNMNGTKTLDYSHPSREIESLSYNGEGISYNLPTHTTRPLIMIKKYRRDDSPLAIKTRTVPRYYQPGLSVQTPRQTLVHRINSPYHSVN